MTEMMLMYSRKLIFKDTVTLYNFIGEVDGNATYAKAIIKHVKFVKHIGKSKNGNGRSPDSTATLHIFDSVAEITDVNGKCKAYLHPEQFKTTDRPDSFFTFRNGNDYVVEGVCQSKTPKGEDAFRVVLASRFTSGTKRMHHWRCDCK
ncbi:MAG: hypothetical protein IKP95_09370 [Ruminococcus sp.]|nr:hypothetical protein [Ruminococcus sp.]